MSKRPRKAGERYVHAERLGRDLKHAREAQGLSIHEVARMAGLTHQHVSKIERGIVSTPIDTLGRLAAQLHMQVAVVERCAQASCPPPRVDALQEFYGAGLALPSLCHFFLESVEAFV